MGNKIVEQENKMIEEIIDNFDFKTCEVVMNALNWTWGFEEQVPTIQMLEKSAVERLKSAMELAKQEKRPNTTYFTSSGGLKANAWINRYGHIEGVRLEFVLTEWDSDGDV
jgi:hypothetical protein